MGLLLGQRYGAQVPRMGTEPLEVANLLDGLSEGAGAVPLGRCLEPLQVRGVSAWPGTVGGVDHLLGHNRRYGGIDLAEDLLLHRCECVSGPVLQAAGTWNQDAPGEQPVAGRLDEVVGVGGIGCMRQQGAGQGGLVIEMKITQAQVGLGPELVL